MRISDVDILIVPGWTGSSADHWQSRWARSMRTARVVEQADWNRPDRQAWTDHIVAAVSAATRPVVLVAHSCGVLAVAHAAPRLAPARVVGAFLVAPGDLEVRRPMEDFVAQSGNDATFPETFLPMPMLRLPFPARLIGSSTDPFCSPQRTRAFGDAWGADTSIIEDAGHINAASGHGPWPEGLLMFGNFLKTLAASP